MYRRILVPIDGSQTSTCALQEALRLVHSSTQLRLIYVLEDLYLPDNEGYAYLDLAPLQTVLRQNGEHLLARAAALAQPSGAATETALLESSGERVAHVIEEDARRWQAELIVIGSHGRSGLSRLLLGSVAEGVARCAPVPVLLVRAG